MKFRISFLFVALFFCTEIFAQNSFFEEARSGVGYFKMERVTDHYYGSYSYQFEIHAAHNGWVEIRKNLPAPILRTNECFIMRRFVSLSPATYNTYLQYTLSVSSDGQNFYPCNTIGMTTAEVGEPWGPNVLALQGSPGNYITSIKIKFRCFYAETPLQDSITTTLKLDYWCFSNFSYPQTIITDFEEVITAINPIGSELPEKFLLLQNYPNPFNPTTTIKFQIQSPTFVNLTVYDATGRKVETLANEKRSAGTHEIDFDGSKLANGTYFYRLTVGDITETKRMILVK